MLTLCKAVLAASTGQLIVFTVLHELVNFTILYLLYYKIGLVLDYCAQLLRNISVLSMFKAWYDCW